MDHQTDKRDNNVDNLQDIEASIYYKTLCSSGLSFVNKQSATIEQKRNQLVESKQRLVYSNYDSLIKLSTFSNDLIEDFQKIEDSLENLTKTIPDFKSKCEHFSHDARQISARWKNVSSMLAKYPQMIEFLEIPQLLNNCIRTFYYEDALKICHFITKFCTRHHHVAPIFKKMLTKIDKSKDVMIAQIVKEMSGNVQLPVCIRLIDYLRQTDRFSEEQLRINFLLARDVWFQSSVAKSTANTHSFSFITTITEVFRVNIFDIVTQYRAIFPDLYTESSASAVAASHTVSGYGETSCKIINSWLLHKIKHYLNLLKLNLDSSVEHESVLPLDTVMDHCFYFGLSMSKIGVDIRPQLIIVFNQFIVARFERKLEDATSRFQASIGNVFKHSNKKSTKYTSGPNNEATLEQFPMLVTYQNDLCNLFNEISGNVPLCLFATFTATLNGSLKKLTKYLNDYVKNHEYSLNQNEFKMYLQLCSVCQNVLIPWLSANFQTLCPISAVSLKFATTVSDWSKTQSLKVFELDIKTRMEEVGSIIEYISSKC